MPSARSVHERSLPVLSPRERETAKAVERLDIAESGGAVPCGGAAVRSGRFTSGGTHPGLGVHNGACFDEERHAFIPPKPSGIVKRGRSHVLCGERTMGAQRLIKSGRWGVAAQFDTCVQKERKPTQAGGFRTVGTHIRFVGVCASLQKAPHDVGVPYRRRAEERKP